MSKITVLLVIWITVFSYVSLAEGTKNARKNANSHCAKPPPTDGTFYKDLKCEGFKKIKGARCQCKCTRSPHNKTRAGWYCPKGSKTTPGPVNNKSTLGLSSTTSSCNTEASTTTTDFTTTTEESNFDSSTTFGSTSTQDDDESSTLGSTATSFDSIIGSSSTMYNK